MVVSRRARFWSALWGSGSLAVGLGLIGCTGHHFPAPPHCGPDPYQQMQSACDAWLSGHPSECGIHPQADPAVLDLRQCIQACVFNNLRIQEGGEKIHQARADFWTESLIPNTSLFADYQLIPLQRANLENQVGPPQADVLWTIPIDWWLFGKRLAAMQAGRLGVEVAAAEQADRIRQKVSDTIEAFYEVLRAKEMVRLVQEDLADMETLGNLAKKQVEQGAISEVERDRLLLAVLDVRRELRRWESNLANAKSKLKPLVGRKDDAFDVHGTLDIRALMPPMPLEEALATAEANRPDLEMERRSIVHAEASIESEKRKAKPLLEIIPGYSYQHQRRITGFPDAHLFDIGVNTSLPITNRNQGGIAKAESQLRASHFAYQAKLTELRSEVEQALQNYKDAYKSVIVDDPNSLKMAKSMHDRIEASFKTGGKSILDLLDAERTYRERQRLIAGNKADYWQSLYKLHATIGTRPPALPAGVSGSPDLLPPFEGPPPIQLGPPK